MSTTNDTPRLVSGALAIGKFVIVATVLALISSIVGIACLYAAVIAFDTVVNPRMREWHDIEYFLFHLPAIVIYVFMYVYLAIIPATIGGEAIGLILYFVALARRLSVWLAAIIGLAVGLIEGGVTAWIVAPLPDSQGWGLDVPRGLLWNAPIGMVQGLFVSLILYAWLKRKMK